MKLNLCSGPNLFPGWLNVDRVDQSEYIRILREDVPPEMAAQWPADQRKLVEYLRGGGDIHFLQLDITREAIPGVDGEVDAIYLGQCIEHFNRRVDVPELLVACHALLKPGGVLRITTPDLDKLLDAYRLGRMHQFAKEQPGFYATADPADQLAYLMYGATGPECDWTNYEGHFHCYTRGTLATALTEAGFKGPFQFFEDASEGILGGETNDKGLSHSLLCEAVK